MSEVTTLKQLMLDAARYRWLRVNLAKRPKFLYGWNGQDSFLSEEELDSFVDGALDSE